MSKVEELIARRKAVVPQGVGIFNPATAISAKGATIIDADGNALIDFAGGIGVLNAGVQDDVKSAFAAILGLDVHEYSLDDFYQKYLETFGNG
jgi:4-aminobutyrate aminotransferase-like enzyme